MLKRAVCLALVLIAALWLGTALAETQTVTVTGTFDQTEARRMLGMINEFRTGGDAWYYTDDSKTTKQYCEGLQPLTYDYDLEKVAMQRAIEVAMTFSHTRPNGEMCYSAYNLAAGHYYAMGENIAGGLGNAATAYSMWREDSFGYSGQGHRRNMLNADFNRVGIGHAVYNGRHFWTQEFGATSSSAGSAAALDGSREMQVQIDLGRVKSVEPSVDSDGLELRYDEAVELDRLVWVELEDTWPRAFPLEIMPGWSVSNGAVAGITGNELKGLGVGRTQMSATVLGKAMTVPVTVRPASLTGAGVALSEGSFIYNGGPQTPQATVELNGKRLEEGRDYTLTYADNVNAGTARAIVTGVNNYEDTASAAFVINPANLSGATIDALPDAIYAAAPHTPEPALNWNSRRLAAGQEYTVSYSDNLNAGTAKVTATGVGNFTGTAQATFTIAPVAISAAQLGAIADITYTGEAIEPQLAMTFGGRLTTGRDFSTVYANNTDVGVAGITITGMGNFMGAVEARFNIIPANLSDAVIGAISAVDYTGEPVTPNVSASIRGRALVRDVDYTLSWRNNTDVTTRAVAVLSGIGNYAGTKERTFEIRLPKGGVFALDSGRYRYESNGTATFLSPAAGVKALKIPDKITVGGKRIKVRAVEERACCGKRGITSVTLGKNVQSIGKSAFANCPKLKTLKGGEALTTIKDSAFSGCGALESVTLEKTVKKVGKNAFKGCKALKRITLKTSRLSGSTVGTNAFRNISAKAVFTCPKKKLNSYEALMRKRGAPKTAKFR